MVDELTQQPFLDYASRDAQAYQRYRPHYPRALFDLLGAQLQRRGQGWDAGTGNGQVAVAVAAVVARVWATDESGAQIALATPHPRVTYQRNPAGQSGLPSASVDLVTVGQALHWFDLPTFYAEADRVLRPGGVLAVWCYCRCQITPAVDRLVEHLYAETLEPYWAPGRRAVEDGYAGLSFPYVTIPVDALEMEVEWGVQELIGYLGTWSAVRKYRTAQGEDPVDSLREALLDAWGSVSRRSVTWPLMVKLGRKPETLRKADT